MIVIGYERCWIGYGTCVIGYDVLSIGIRSYNEPKIASVILYEINEKRKKHFNIALVAVK